MTPTEQEKVRQWSRQRTAGGHIRVIITADERGARFERFADEMIACAPTVAVEKRRQTDSGPPEIRVGRNLVYHTLPSDRELSPFLDLVDGRGDLSEELRERLGDVPAPVELRLYITPHCPFCPRTVATLGALPLVSRLVRLVIVDGMLFPEMAEEDGIRAAPTVVLDDARRWSGECPPEEIVAALLDREVADPGPAALRNMIEEGAAEKAAQLMADRERLFPAFIELLTDEKWPVRLGSMVIFENLAVLSPTLARSAADLLWERFESVTATVQGDILYLMGESGDRRMMPRLSAVVHGEGEEEVKEAAREALETLQETCAGDETDV